MSGRLARLICLPLALALVPARAPATPRAAALPPLVLWVWERPEDLTSDWARKTPYWF